MSEPIIAIGGIVWNSNYTTCYVCLCFSCNYILWNHISFDTRLCGSHAELKH